MVESKRRQTPPHHGQFQKRQAVLGRRIGWCTAVWVLSWSRLNHNSAMMARYITAATRYAMRQLYKLLKVAKNTGASAPAQIASQSVGAEGMAQLPGWRYAGSKS